jgi:hypothetical protein
MDASLAPELLDELYSDSKFKYIDHTAVSGKYEQSSFKNKGPSPGPRNQNCNFL